MKSKLLLLALAVASSSCLTRRHNDSLSTPWFVSANAKEMKLQFEGDVEFILRSGQPTEEEARDQVLTQVQHMFGPMERAARKAVPKTNQRITKIQFSKHPSKPNTFVAKYLYTGTLLVENAPQNTYDVVLPINPDKIYEVSMVGSENPCTDHHYQSEGDFWYFWSPNRSGCKLQKDVDYKVFTGKLLPVNNMLEKSFPDYPRFADNGVVTVTMMLGLDDPTKTWNPDSSNDHNAPNFKTIRNKLNQMNFKPVKVWAAQDFTDLLAKHNPRAPAINALMSPLRELPRVEEFEKDYPASSKYKKVKVRLFYGASGINEQSTAFHYLFKDSLENDSMMIYAGHSGLGGHLDLNSINQIQRFSIKPNKSKYQLYYFNSCSSYSYYNTMYFSKKRGPGDKFGTKNLDIFNNGLATYFHVMSSTISSLVEAVDAFGMSKRATSYQDLAVKIDSNNLFAINGDEDNPTSF